MDQELYEKQIENEHLYNRNQEMFKIKQYFMEEDKDFREIIEETGTDEKLAVELVSFMYDCQHANIDMLVGHMLRFFSDVQSCCDWISDAVDNDFVDYNGKSFNSCWIIPTALEKEFELYQYPLPMLVKPHKRKKNSDSAYYTIEKDSVFCGNSYTTEDCCIEILYKQDCVGLKLNITIANLSKNQWRSLVGGKKPDESIEHWKEKLTQFENYDRAARQLVAQFADKEFFLTNKYDKRGRIYDQGYFIHSQGTDWNKGCIEFSHKELVEG